MAATIAGMLQAVSPKSTAERVSPGGEGHSANRLKATAWIRYTMISAPLRPMWSEAHPQTSPHSRLTHPMVMNRPPAAAGV